MERTPCEMKLWPSMPKTNKTSRAGRWRGLSTGLKVDGGV